MRNTIDPSYTTIGMLFEKNFLFEVPKYQRYYSWEDEQVDEGARAVFGSAHGLIADLYRAV